MNYRLLNTLATVWDAATAKDRREGVQNYTQKDQFGLLILRRATFPADHMEERKQLNDMKKSAADWLSPELLTCPLLEHCADSPVKLVDGFIIKL